MVRAYEAARRHSSGSVRLFAALLGGLLAITQRVRQSASTVNGKRGRNFSDRRHAASRVLAITSRPASNYADREPLMWDPSLPKNQSSGDLPIDQRPHWEPFNSADAFWRHLKTAEKQIIG